MLAESEPEREPGLASVCGRIMAEGEPGRAQVKQQAMVLDWVWEYIMLNCKSFDIVGSIANEIPMPDSARLKKMVLLKLISLDFMSSSSSTAPRERDLVALEGLEDLYAQECSNPDLVPHLRRLKLMAKAEMAVVHLRTNKWDDFCEALDKLWGENLVQDTEEAAGSDDPELQSLWNTVKSDLWAVKSRPKMQSFVVEEYKRETVMDMVKRFLDLARAELGPSFLEIAEKDVLEGRYLPGKRHQAQQQQGTNKRIRKSLLPSLSEEAVHPAAGEFRGEMNRDEAVSAGLRSPEVETALNELKRSQLTLRQHVKDPLPDAIEVAKELKRSNGQSAGAQEDQTGDQAAVAAAAAALAAGVGQPETRKFSIMDRHPSARVTQWDDDEIECSPQPGSPSASNRVQLPKGDNTVKQRISPLPKAQLTKTRRKKNKWTQLEEDTLRKAVDLHGKGRWKIILENNRKVFENRNEVDLKDKWRNIEKAEGMKR